MRKAKWPNVLNAIVRYMTLLLVALRACDVIDWPWWCVLSPTIATLAFSALALIVVGCLYASDD